MFKLVYLLFILAAMLFFDYCNAQTHRVKEGYSNFSFYLVYPDTMKEILAANLTDECRDSILLFQLHLTFKVDSSITNDSIYYICNKTKIHTPQLTNAFKQIKFTCEKVKSDYSDYSFILPIRIRTKLVIGK
jgi:hypothetical protein